MSLLFRLGVLYGVFMLVRFKIGLGSLWWLDWRFAWGFCCTAWGSAQCLCAGYIKGLVGSLKLFGKMLIYYSSQVWGQQEPIFTF